jgi:hypothetical protein
MPPYCSSHQGQVKPRKRGPEPGIRIYRKLLGRFLHPHVGEALSLPSTYRPYSPPSTPQPQQATGYGRRPECWGREYNQEVQLCRDQCSFRATCREDTIRQMQGTRSFQPPAPPPPYAPPASPYQTPMTAAAAPYRLPVVVPVQPTRPAAPVSMVSQPTPQHSYMRAPEAPWTVGQYGAFNDPAFSMMAQIPPVIRPQQPNETFFERVLINAGLGILEQLTAQMYLALRQAVMYRGQ